MWFVAYSYVWFVTHLCVSAERSDGWRVGTALNSPTKVAFSCRSFSTKEPLITGLFCGKNNKSRLQSREQRRTHQGVAVCCSVSCSVREYICMYIPECVMQRRTPACAISVCVCECLLQNIWKSANCRAFSERHAYTYTHTHVHSQTLSHTHTHTQRKFGLHIS